MSQSEKPLCPDCGKRHSQLDIDEIQGRIDAGEEITDEERAFVAVETLMSVIEALGKLSQAVTNCIPKSQASPELIDAMKESYAIQGAMLLGAAHGAMQRAVHQRRN